MKTPEKIISLFFLLCFIFSCDEPILYHSYHSLPGEGWLKSDTLFFPLSPEPRQGDTWEVYVEVRNNNRYPYRDLHLTLFQNIADSLVWSSQSVSVQLADREGRWRGSGWGTLHQSAVSAGQYKPEREGEYLFKIVHRMEGSALYGINDIGIRIERKP